MRHQTISFIKSGLRIAGFGLLPMLLFINSKMLVITSVYWTGGLLVVAELLGIVEELGHE